MQNALSCALTLLHSCSAHLRQLSELRSFISPADLEKVIHTLIKSSLDYCNALYSGIRR